MILECSKPRLPNGGIWSGGCRRFAQYKPLSCFFADTFRFFFRNSLQTLSFFRFRTFLFDWKKDYERIDVLFSVISEKNSVHDQKITEKNNNWILTCLSDLRTKIDPKQPDDRDALLHMFLNLLLNQACLVPRHFRHFAAMRCLLSGKQQRHDILWTATQRRKWPRNALITRLWCNSSARLLYLLLDKQLCSWWCLQQCGGSWPMP